MYRSNAGIWPVRIEWKAPISRIEPDQETRQGRAGSVQVLLARSPAGGGECARTEGAISRAVTRSSADVAWPVGNSRPVWVKRSCRRDRARAHAVSVMLDYE
jgi:hypothetical protein